MPLLTSCFSGSGGPMLHTRLVLTKPFLDQNVGVHGLQKPIEYFYEANYLENFIECVLLGFGRQLTKATLIIGGDGREYSKAATTTIIQMCPSHKVAKVIVGQDGLLSTPAASCLIHKYKAVCGLIITASTSHCGSSNYIGIKINGSGGGPAPDSILEEIENLTKKIERYWICKDVRPDFTEVRSHRYTTEFGQFMVDVIDPVKDYLRLMKTVFFFPSIKRLLHGHDDKPGYRVIVDCMNGVMGVYVKRIMCEELGLCEEDIVREESLTDFGGIDPNPFMVTPVEFSHMIRKRGYDMGIAFDADGDRHRIFSESGTVLDPCDSLAFIAANLEYVPFYAKKGIRGYACTMTTSSAIDRVATKKGKLFYIVPPDIRYCNALADAGKVTVWGDELAGIGSTHIREFDGMWVLLTWLSVISELDLSIDQVMNNHWTQFGRSYYGRCDYNQMLHASAEKVLQHLAMLVTNQSIVKKTYKVTGDWFGEGKSYKVESMKHLEYGNKLTGETIENLGVEIILEGRARIIIRECEYPMKGVDIHIYVEHVEEDIKKIHDNPLPRVAALMDVANQISKIEEFSGLGPPKWTHMPAKQRIDDKRKCSEVTRKFAHFVRLAMGRDSDEEMTPDKHSSASDITVIDQPPQTTGLMVYPDATPERVETKTDADANKKRLESKTEQEEQPRATKGKRFRRPSLRKRNTKDKKGSVRHTGLSKAIVSASQISPFTKFILEERSCNRDCVLKKRQVNWGIAERTKMPKF